MASGKPLRLALFSPLNPVRSGISDYTEENLPYWSEHADIDVVVDSYEPSTPAVRENHRVLTPDELETRVDEYDGALYQVGNNYAHCGYMVPSMKALPGVAVIHDYSLSYLMLGLTAMQGDLDSLDRILERSSFDGPGRSSTDLLLSRVDPYEVSLAAPIVEMARGVIVHNRFAESRIRRAFPHKRMTVILHPTPIREPSGTRSELRRKYGFRDEDEILASVSSVAYNKRLGILMEAVAAMSSRRPNLKLLVVGQGSIGGDLRRTIEARGIADRVVLTGWVTAEEYLDYIDLADVVADLRYPTAGETSGSILRAMQAGKPLIVADHGFFAELEDSFAWKVPVGDEEQSAFNKALTALLEDGEKRTAMGAAARRFTLENLRREDAAKRYIDFVAEALAAKDTVTPWDLPSPSAGALKRRSVSTIYKLGRLAYYSRRYGWSDTWKKIRSTAAV